MRRWLAILGVIVMAQPVLIRYTLGTETVEVPAHYAGGLEGSFVPGVEEGGRSVGVPRPSGGGAFMETAVSLTTSTSLSISYIVGRVSGVWSNFGNSGTGTVWSIAEAPNGDIYVGGDFVGFGGVTGADYIAYWNGSTWNKVGASSDINAKVKGLLFDPGGNLYVIGQFTDAGGVANADYIAYWNGSSWSAVGNPNSGGASITQMVRGALDSSGNLYIVGQFSNLAGVAGTVNLAKWDGSSWGSIGTVAGGVVQTIIIDPVDTIYVGGAFTSIDSVSNTTKVAYYDGSIWNPLGPGLNDTVWNLGLNTANELYVAGEFTETADSSVSLSRVGIWDGSAWQALGSGVRSGVEIASEIIVTPVESIIVGGTFTSAGGSSLPDRIAKWTGSQWEALDIDLPGAPYIYALMSKTRLTSKYDIYIGFTTTGTATVSGASTTTITNNGSAPVSPTIKIKRIGGTSAMLETIRNETTGRQLLFDLAILDGETVTIDTQAGTVTSDFRGDLIDKMLPSSDFQDWALLPGDNAVYTYVSTAGSPTITATMQWRECYWSVDDLTIEALISGTLLTEAGATMLTEVGDTILWEAGAVD